MSKQRATTMLISLVNILSLVWLWLPTGQRIPKVGLDPQLGLVITLVFGLSLVAPWLLEKNYHWQPWQIAQHWSLGWLGLSILVVGFPSVFQQVSVPEIGIGLLISFFGVLCVDVPRNHLIGVRVVWTYASAAIWHKVNRVGGWLLYVSGLLGIVAGVFGQAIGMTLLVGLTLTTSAIVVGYAYWLARLSRRPM